MKSLISKAQEFYKESEIQTNVDFETEEFGSPRIIVIGCGGAGNNTVDRLERIGIDGVTTIAVNTDQQHLRMVRADKKLLIGKSLTKGLGAGGYPEIGRKAAEMSRNELEALIGDADLVFLCAGLGGGTGTGASPVIAEIAKKAGAIVVAFVQMPFKFEKARIFKAENGLEELKKYVDTAVVLDNNKLLEYVPNLPIEQAFSVMDQLVAETIKGISETITRPSLVNLDFADVKAVMKYGDLAVMLFGESRSQNRAKDVVYECLNHPLLEVDYRGARGALIHISGGPDLTIKEAQDIVENLTFEIDSCANVIWGARIDKELEGIVKVVAIMAGVQTPSMVTGSDERRYEREELYKEVKIDFL